MQLYAYDVQAPDGGIVHHLSPLPHELVFERGLPNEAIIASCRDGQPFTREYAVPNANFVAFLQHVIAKHLQRSERLSESALRLGEGSLYLVDQRSPHSSEQPEPEDVIGVVHVQRGTVVQYVPSAAYRAIGRNGLFVLDEWFAARLMEELTALAHAMSTRAPTHEQGDPKIVFRDARGRELSWNDLKHADGRVQWEVIGSEQIDPRAAQLHQQGRQAGARGEHQRALQLFAEASSIAPEWPYPVYDAALTHLLMGDVRTAHRGYAQVDRMSPRGFFTAKTSLHALEQELNGLLPAGFCRAFAMLEWLDDRNQKRSLLEQIVARHPNFAPAWKELSRLLEGGERYAAVMRGLAAQPDDETRGILLINKAIVLHERGELHAAIDILGTLALDPLSTLGTEMLAKAALANLISQSGAES